MVELSYDELDGYIRQVCTGQKIVYLLNKAGKEIALLLKYPTAEDTMLASHFYKEALKEAEEAGLPSLDDVEVLIRERGLFSVEDEENIASLQSKLDAQKSVLAKTTKVPANRTRLKGIINGLQKRIEDIQLKREVRLENTRERKATEVKFLYLTWRGSFDPITDARFWKDHSKFDAEKDFVFRRQVFLEYIIFSHGLKQEIIRCLARSNLWRIRYMTAVKTGEVLFGIPIKDYSVDQLMLLYWSHYYQSINEMMSDDRPSDEIIEDDQALDAYMSDWQADRSRDAVASKAKKSKKYGQASAWDHGETIVMKSNPIHQDVEYSETLAQKTKNAKVNRIDAAPIGRTKESNVFKGKGGK